MHVYFIQNLELQIIVVKITLLGARPLYLSALLMNNNIIVHYAGKAYKRHNSSFC